VKIFTIYNLNHKSFNLHKTDELIMYLNMSLESTNTLKTQDVTPTNRISGRSSHSVKLYRYLVNLFNKSRF
jgi:hypothetical protein